MTVKYEDDVYECLKDRRLTTQQMISETGRSRDRIWTALTQLEQKDLITQVDGAWVRVDESD